LQHRPSTLQEHDSSRLTKSGRRGRRTAGPRKLRSRKARWLLVGVPVLFALVLASSGAEAAGCKKVSGKFTLTSVTGPTCTSAVDICAAGSYSGGLAGQSAFTGTSLIQTVDTPTTGVVLLTVDNQITTKAGTLATRDAIALRTTGTGDFAEVDTVISGTGEWAGATGVLRAQGTFTAQSGGSGEYVGEICPELGSLRSPYGPCGQRADHRGGTGSAGLRRRLLYDGAALGGPTAGRAAMSSSSGGAYQALDHGRGLGGQLQVGMGLADVELDVLHELVLGLGGELARAVHAAVRAPQGIGHLAPRLEVDKTDGSSSRWRHRPASPPGTGQAAAGSERPLSARSNERLQDQPASNHGRAECAPIRTHPGSSAPVARPCAPCRPCVTAAC
jgi:hypothetical protein